MIQNTLSSTHGSKDPECARINSYGVQITRNKFSRFGELGLNSEAKASKFEPNLSLSVNVFVFVCVCWSVWKSRKHIIVRRCV